MRRHSKTEFINFSNQNTWNSQSKYKIIQLLDYFRSNAIWRNCSSCSSQSQFPSHFCNNFFHFFYFYCQRLDTLVVSESLTTWSKRQILCDWPADDTHTLGAPWEISSFSSSHCSNAWGICIWSVIVLTFKSNSTIHWFIANKWHKYLNHFLWVKRQTFFVKKFISFPTFGEFLCKNKTKREIHQENSHHFTKSTLH